MVTLVTLPSFSSFSFAWFHSGRWAFSTYVFTIQPQPRESGVSAPSPHAPVIRWPGEVDQPAGRASRPARPPPPPCAAAALRAAASALRIDTDCQTCESKDSDDNSACSHETPPRKPVEIKAI